MLSNRYALEELIAKGGMASVYRARDDVLARPVAVKILLADLAADAAFLERFRREALAAAGLTHPNIIAIFDTGEESDASGVVQHFMVMEYCGGGTLANLAGGKPLPADKVKSIAVHICDALAYAHDNGIVHRDIKPDNVLFAEDGTVKVADFGIAKAAFSGRDLTTTGSILGTVTYLAPEQAKGEEPDARSDIYSLGALLYELTTGRPPFQGETQLATALKHVHEAPVPPGSVRAGIPRDLDSAIMRCLEKEPGARPRTALELRAALGGSTQQVRVVPPAASTTTTVVHAESGDARWVAKVIVAIVLVVLAVIGVAWYLAPDEGGSRRSNEAHDAASALTIQSAVDFDPHGTGGEHPTTVEAAWDGDPGTVWTTEDYSDPLQILKPGVGLVFDMGRPVSVSTVQVVTTTPGIDVEIRAGAESPTTEQDMDVVGSASNISAQTDIDVSGPTAQYWLLWITRLPGDGAGEAAVAEVRFFDG